MLTFIVQLIVIYMQYTKSRPEAEDVHLIFFGKRSLLINIKIKAVMNKNIFSRDISIYFLKSFSSKNFIKYWEKKNREISREKMFLFITALIFMFICSFDSQ